MKTTKIWLLVLVSCSLASMVSGQMRVPSRPAQGAVSWKTQPWTGNDKPYQDVEARIDKRITSSADARAIIQECEAKARKNLNDPMAQFAWAYAVQKDYPSSPIPQPPFDALATADPKNVYRYTRLRFLLTREVNLNGNHADLKAIGHRLLQRDPKDRQVRLTLIYALASSRSSLHDALSEAQAWASVEPNDPGSHAVLAYIYQTMDAYNRGRNIVDREKAVQEYQQYLRLAPRDDHFRGQAMRLIASLKTEKPW